MIDAVLSVTLFGMSEGEDRFRVTTVREDGEVVDITPAYEILAAETEDGRTGWAVFPKERDDEHR